MTRIESTAIYKSQSAENMLLEAAMILQALENSDTFNVTNPKKNAVNITINTDAKTATISATLPIAFLHEPNTNVSSMVATEYLLTPNNQPLTSRVHLI